VKKVQGDIADAERMLKALIRSLEKKHLNPWSSNLSTKLNGRKNRN